MAYKAIWCIFIFHITQMIYDIRSLLKVQTYLLNSWLVSFPLSGTVRLYTIPSELQTYNGYWSSVGQQMIYDIVMWLFVTHYITSDNNIAHRGVLFVMYIMIWSRQ